MKSVDNLSDTQIDALYKKIGKNVKRYREMQGITQLQLSLAMNLKSPGLISQAELYTNKQHLNIKHLYQIAYILECDITDFFGESIEKLEKITVQSKIDGSTGSP